MKKIIGYLKSYKDTSFNIWVFVAIILFTAWGVYFNYFDNRLQQWKLQVLWEHSIIIYFFVLFAVPFIGSYLIQAVLTKDFELFTKTRFWILTFMALLIFALRSSSHLWMQHFWQQIQEEPLALFWYRIVNTIFRMALVLVPLTVYWWFTDRKEMPLYGFTLKNYDTRPYMVMLAVMIPLIAWASFQADFLSTYPRGGEIDGLSLSNQADWKYYGIYEFFYGIDFIFIEFFFRGFLILAFLHVAGPKAILPMASFYVYIHFGKPLGETVSSFFGGTLLGIIAYYSRSIAGGIIVHMGIAWLMELGALLSKIYR